MNSQNLGKPTLRLKSRRSRRIDLDVPVVVHRPPNEGPRFSENTKTLVVNAHGALLALKGMVAPSQSCSCKTKPAGNNKSAGWSP